jgi:hypothetical protein
MVMSQHDPGHYVAIFADSVVKENAYLMDGDARRGNRQADRRVKAVRALFAMGDAGRDALCALMTHERPDVRTAAACRLLRYRTAEAKAVLEREARGRGLTALDASECLKRWEEGAWQLDPGD